MVKLTQLRCPGDKRHTKRRGQFLVTEECCNTLLGFMNTKVDDTELAYKCKDCKSIVHVVVKQGIAYVNVMPSETKIKLEEGKVVVE